LLRAADGGFAEDLVAPDHDADDQQHRRQRTDSDGEVDQQQAASENPADEQADRYHDHRENNAEADQRRAPRTELVRSARLATIVLS